MKASVVASTAPVLAIGILKEPPCTEMTVGAC